MIMDSLLDFGTVALSSGGNLPNVVNVKTPGDAIGDELYFHVQTCGSEVPTGGTGATVKLQTADAENFSDAVDLITGTVKLEGGRMQFCARMPLGCRKYLRAVITPTGSFSAGRATAFLAHGPQHSYKDLK